MTQAPQTREDRLRDRKLMNSVVEFDEAFEKFTDAYWEDDQTVSVAIHFILRMLENITKNPHESKFRRIKAVNSTFCRKIGSLRGMDGVMRALSFKVSATLLFISCDTTPFLVYISVSYPFKFESF
jgi:hypothetical protein